MQIYAPPSHIKVPELAYTGAASIQAYQAAEQAYIEELQAWAKRLAPSSKIAGELVSMPYADGAALYVIIQSSGRHGIMTVPVGDAWRDPYFENTVTVKYLTEYVTRDRQFRKRRAELDARR